MILGGCCWLFKCWLEIEDIQAGVSPFHTLSIWPSGHGSKIGIADEPPKTHASHWSDGVEPSSQNALIGQNQRCALCEAGFCVRATDGQTDRQTNGSTRRYLPFARLEARKKETDFCLSVCPSYFVLMIEKRIRKLFWWFEVGFLKIKVRRRLAACSLLIG